MIMTKQNMVHEFEVRIRNRMNPSSLLVLVEKLR